MNFKAISEAIRVDEVPFPIQLFANPVASREKSEESNSIAAYKDIDQEKYINCLQKLNK